jgi:hypothetical protein
MELVDPQIAGTEKAVLIEGVRHSWAKPLLIGMKQVISRVDELGYFEELTTCTAPPIQFLNHRFKLPTWCDIDDTVPIYRNECGNFWRHQALKHGKDIPDELQETLLQVSGKEKNDARVQLICQRCKPKPSWSRWNSERFAFLLTLA